MPKSPEPTIASLVDQIVAMRYRVEKLKSTKPEYYLGYLSAVWTLAYSLDEGCNKKQIRERMLRMLEMYETELAEKQSDVLSDLYAKLNS